jgi:hypothetical protein
MILDLVALQTEAEAVMSIGSVAWRLGLAFVLVAANGFFVAAEFALVGARKTRIEALARTGNRRARLAHAAISKLDHYISGTQLGITLASLGLGWVGESTIAGLLIGAFSHLPAPFDVIAGHTVAGTLAFAFITFLHIVLGELAPKSLALLFPEATSMWTAGPLIIFARIFTPFIVVLNGAANLLLRWVGLRAPTEMERVHRPEEIEMLLTQSYEHGLLREEPVEMIRGVFDLSETTRAHVKPLEHGPFPRVRFAAHHGHGAHALHRTHVEHHQGQRRQRGVNRRAVRAFLFLEGLLQRDHAAVRVVELAYIIDCGHGAHEYLARRE